jgi:hypothetical protein
MTAILEQKLPTLYSTWQMLLTGVNAEAGLYAFSALSYTNLWLNYTSVVATAANVADTT